MVLAFLPLSQLILGLLLQSSQDSEIKPQAVIEDVNLVGNFSEEEGTRMEVTLLLPNDCYTVKKIDLRFDSEKDTLLFFPELSFRKASASTPSKCGLEPIRAVKWVDLGELTEGSYQVRELMSLKPWAKFKIAKTSNPESETIGFYKH